MNSSSSASRLCLLAGITLPSNRRRDHSPHPSSMRDVGAESREPTVFVNSRLSNRREQGIKVTSWRHETSKTTKNGSCSVFCVPSTCPQKMYACIRAKRIPPCECGELQFSGSQKLLSPLRSPPCAFRLRLDSPEKWSRQDMVTTFPPKYSRPQTIQCRSCQFSCIYRNDDR